MSIANINAKWLLCGLAIFWLQACVQEKVARRTGTNAIGFADGARDSKRSTADIRRGLGKPTVGSDFIPTRENLVDITRNHNSNIYDYSVDELKAEIDMLFREDLSKDISELDMDDPDDAELLHDYLIKTYGTANVEAMAEKLELEDSLHDPYFVWEEEYPYPLSASDSFRRVYGDPLSDYTRNPHPYFNLTADQYDYKFIAGAIEQFADASYLQNWNEEAKKRGADYYEASYRVEQSDKLVIFNIKNPTPADDYNVINTVVGFGVDSDKAYWMWSIAEDNTISAIIFDGVNDPTSVSVVHTLTRKPPKISCPEGLLPDGSSCVPDYEKIKQEELEELQEAIRRKKEKEEEEEEEEDD